MAYLILRTLHLVGSAVLFGTALAMGYFLWMAVRSGDSGALRATLRHVIRAEWWFTVPMVVVQPLTGFLLMDVLGYSRDSAWFHAVMGSYALLGLVWLPVLATQYRLQKLVGDFEANPAAQGEFTRVLRWWGLFSVLMYLGAIWLFVLMVYKPGLALTP